MSESWANDVCSQIPDPLIAGSSDLGGYEEREADLIEVLQKFIGRGLDGWDSESWNEREELSTYTSHFGATFLPGVIIAGLLLLAWLPLWISRCCAHRCCRPTRPSYSSKQRTMVGGCCSLWGVGTLVCAIIGILSCDQLGTGMQAELCAAHSSLDAAEAQMRTTETAVDALKEATDDFVTEFDTLVDAVSALAAFSEMTTACADLQSASTTANQIEADVAAEGGDVQTVASWNEMRTALAQSIEDGCTTLPNSVQQPAQAAEADLEDARTTIDTLHDNLGELESYVGDGSQAMNDTDKEVIKAMDKSWDYFGDHAALLGLAIFAVPLLLVVAAVAGGACMAATRSKNDGCVNACGVQLAGVAWVGISIVAVELCFSGAVVVVLGVGVKDVGTLLRRTTDPTILLTTERCAAPMNSPWREEGDTRGVSLYFDWTNDNAYDTTIDFCEVWRDCMDATKGTSLVLRIEDAFNISLDADALNTTITDGVTASGIDTVDVSAANGTLAFAGVAEASMAELLADVGALCGGACSQEVEASLSSQLADMDAHVQAAAANISVTVGYAETLVAQVPRVLGASVAPLLEAMGLLAAALDCGWLPDVYLPPFEPLLGDVSSGLAGLGISMLCTGCLGILFMCWLIPLQVCCGGVGRQPGCPRPCRCCCPSAQSPGGRVSGPGVKRRKSVPKELQVVESSVIAV